MQSSCLVFKTHILSRLRLDFLHSRAHQSRVKQLDKLQVESPTFLAGVSCVPASLNTYVTKEPSICPCFGVRFARCLLAGVWTPQRWQWLSSWACGGRPQRHSQCDAFPCRSVYMPAGWPPAPAPPPRSLPDPPRSRWRAPCSRWCHGVRISRCFWPFIVESSFI